MFKETSEGQTHSCDKCEADARGESTSYLSHSAYLFHTCGKKPPNHHNERVEEIVKSLKPQIKWLPRSEEEYLKRQRLLPVFQGWINQIWEQQEQVIKTTLQTYTAECEARGRESVFEAMKTVEVLAAYDEWWNGKKEPIMLDYFEKKLREALTPPTV